jgi:hypothetical protein
MFHIISPLLIVIRFDIIACMVKGLISKNHCQIIQSNTNKGQVKSWVVLGAQYLPKTVP